MFYGDRDAQDEAIAAKVKTKRDAAALFPIIRDATLAFDGKVYNCRFENALRESGNYIFTEKTKYYFEIYLYDRGNRIVLAHISIDDMPDGKRIPADLIVKSAREKRESLLREAAQIERDAAQADMFKQQLEYFREQLEKIRDSIHSDVRDIYNLDYRVHR